MSLPSTNGHITFGELESLEWLEPEVRAMLIIYWAEERFESFFALLDTLPRHKAERAMKFLAGVSG